LKKYAEFAPNASNRLRAPETEKEEYGDWAEVLDWARNTLPDDSTTLQVIESYQDGLIPIADYDRRLDMVARMLKAEAAKAARTI
jgi:hypothetical protein